MIVKALNRAKALYTKHRHRLLIVRQGTTTESEHGETAHGRAIDFADGFLRELRQLDYGTVLDHRVHDADLPATVNLDSIRSKWARVSRELRRFYHHDQDGFAAWQQEEYANKLMIESKTEHTDAITNLEGAVDQEQSRFVRLASGDHPIAKTTNELTTDVGNQSLPVSNGNHMESNQKPAISTSSGYLGLSIDAGRFEVRRQGFQGKKAVFAGRKLLWHLLLTLFKNGEVYCPKEVIEKVWSDHGNSEYPASSTMDSAKSDLNTLLEPLSVCASSVSRCWKLFDTTEGGRRRRNKTKKQHPRKSVSNSK
jgi:hypothetical protein